MTPVATPVPLRAFCILCRDVDQHLAFYTDCLGLAVKRREEGFAAFDTTRIVVCLWEIGHIAVNLQRFERPPGVEACVAAIRLACSPGEAAAIGRRVRARGIAVRETSEGFVFVDPNATEWRIESGRDGDVPGIALFVRDLQASHRFYEQGMGFARLGQSEHWVDYVGQGDTVLRIEQCHQPCGPIHAAMPALGFDTQAEVVEQSRCIAENGLEIEVPARLHPWNFVAAYLSDPDGHIWEIYASVSTAPSKSVELDLVERLTRHLGASSVLVGDDVAARPASRSHLTAPCRALALVRPKNTAEVSDTLRLCHAVSWPVVTRGGMTGLVDGALCGPGEIALSLESMVGIESFDPVGQTITVLAGTPLQVVQDYVEERGLFFPLDLGARGSATIGGNIATNAGGNRVLRYGMMRELVLGLEAVLADGTIVSAMHGLIKNNTGLDVKQLFIGTEGTLGVVTRAVLRLWPQPQEFATAFIACPTFDALIDVLQLAGRKFSSRVTAFEAMWPDFYAAVTQPERVRPPLDRNHPFYALIEISVERGETEACERMLSDLMDAGRVLDAVVAKSQAQRSDLWAVRDAVHYFRPDGFEHYFDVSLPLRSIDRYVLEVRKRIVDHCPSARVLSFGHIGDGNIHWVIDAPGAAEFLQGAVYEPLAELGGSVSAEHGIGLQKKHVLHLSRTPAELAVMRSVKAALDPRGILNPGKIF